jgi:hypothetical protein
VRVAGRSRNPIAAMAGTEIEPTLQGAGEGRGSYAGGSLGVTCPSGILLRQRRLSQPRGFERVGLVQEREGRDALPVPEL